MMLKEALMIVLVGYLGSGGTPRNQDLHEREVIMYVRPDMIQAPAGQKTLTLDRVTMPDELRNVLTSYNAEYLTKSCPDYNPADTITYSPEGRPVKKMDLSRVYYIRFPEGTNLDSIIVELNRIGGVILAERIPIFRLMAMPNDEFFQYQWGLHNTGQAGGTPGEDIHAAGAWNIFTGSTNVKIGIIDAGVKSNHEDLQGKVVSGESGYSDPHGTHVAGIATAITNNGTGVAGVDWNARIDARDISSFDPSEIYDDIVASVDAGSGVLNNSWGGPGYSVLVRWAFHYAYEMNRVQVVSMGNSHGEDLLFPAGFPVVLAVGATTNNGARSDYSTYGSHIDVVAPGGVNPYPSNDEHDILSTWTTNDFQGRPYRYLAGTSMSAPFVTGLASLLKGFKPDLTNDDIMWIIRVSADDINQNQYPGWDEYIGYGRINAERALNYAELPYKVEHFTASGGTDYSSTDWYGMYFPMRGLDPDQAGWRVKRHEVRKTVYLPNSDYAEKWVWGRKESVGWSKGDLTSPPYQWEEGWCEPASIQNNTVVLRTYVYEVQKVNIVGQPYGDIEWWPTTPGNVDFAYTLLARRPIFTPTSLSVQNQEANVTLTWQDNSDNEMGFLIYRSGDGEYYSIIDTVFTHGNGIGSRNYTDTTGEIAHTYWYKIRGFAGRYYSEYSDTARVELSTLLSPEIISDSVNCANNSVFISFRDNSAYNTSYTIQKYNITRNTWSTYEIEDTVGIKNIIRTFEDNNINLWEEYVYHIKAVNDTYNLSSSESVKYVLAAPSIITDAEYNNSGRRFLYARGKYMAVYKRNGRIYYAESSNGMHFNTQLVSDDITGCDRPVISANNQGIAIAFRSGSNIYYVKNTGGEWSIPQKIDDVNSTNDYVTGPAIMLKADTAIIVYREHIPEDKNTDTHNHLVARLITLDGTHNNTRIAVLDRDSDLKDLSIGGWNTIRILGVNHRDSNRIELYKINSYGIVYDSTMGYGNSPNLAYNNGYYYLSWVEGGEYGGEIKTRYIYGDEWGSPINTGIHVERPTYPYITGNNQGKWWILYETWDSPDEGVYVMTIEPRGVWNNRKIVNGYNYNMIGTSPQAVISEYTSGVETHTVIKMWFRPYDGKTYYYYKELSSGTASPYAGKQEMIRKKLQIESGNIIQSDKGIRIKYYAPAMKEVKIDLYGADGRRIKPIVKRRAKENGIYSARVKTHGLWSGVYFIAYRNGEGDKITRKIMITR